MPYIAMRRMTNTPVDSDVTTHYEPGDPIDDFMAWPENARFILLRDGYVQPSFEDLARAADGDGHARRKAAKAKSTGEA